jgi:hypothetical protein
MWSAHERVLRALDFQRPDRMPIYDSFWPEFVEAWRAAKGRSAEDAIDDYYGMDVASVIPDETPFPSQKAVIEDRADYAIARDGWGMVQRVPSGAKFYETLAVALPEKRLLDQLSFESPLLDTRYTPQVEVQSLQRKRCVFIKTGGPYLRTSNLRGTERWLIDLAEDPSFAYQLAMKVTQHITLVGLEALRRYNAYEAGIWFFDDMGANIGPMFSPRTFERVFYPCYRWMCEQYRAAGARHILLHCDGNIEAILDGLLDAGIRGIHPVEPKAGMDALALRKRYGRRLALLGGLDNAHILPRGTRAEVGAHVRHVLEAGQDGGLVIGAHSIGPDVSIGTYDYVHALVLKHGTY